MSRPDQPPPSWQQIKAALAPPPLRPSPEALEVRRTDTSIRLRPHEPAIVSGDDCLANTTEVRQETGVDFDATLQAIVTLGPEPPMEVLIFDRGPVRRGMRGLHPGGINRPAGDPLRDDERYMILTQRPGNEGNLVTSWGAFGLPERSHLDLGRRAGNPSEGHVRLEFGDNGDLRITDLGSSNGTWVRAMLSGREADAGYLSRPAPVTDYVSDPPLAATKTAAADAPPPPGDPEPEAPNPERENPLRLESASAQLLDAHGQDRIINAPRFGVFAVFDGITQGGDGGAAAEAARVAAGKVLRNAIAAGVTDETAAEAAILKAIEAASRAAKAAGGGTTGTICLVFEEGRRQRMAYGSVGDSRLSAVRRFEVEQMTDDEVVMGSELTNSLGAGYEALYERGVIDMDPETIYLITSDGVHGSYDGKGNKNILGPDEVITAVRRSGTLDEGVRKLVHKVAREEDDRSAVAFRQAA